ncbi:MAG: alpha-hydroxy-acid oxidizing protein, partial [Pseudomonadota bacterium]
MSPPITCIDDLQALYHRRVPRMFVDYVESGSWSESTLRANRLAFDGLTFNQRVAIDLSERSVSAPLLGTDYALPVALAPIGMGGMQRADGEILAARAAEAIGVPYTLSTMSVCSIEDVAAATTAPFWFQLYVMRDEGFVRSLIDRAR